MSDLPEILSAIVLGPEDRLLLIGSADHDLSDAELDAVSAALEACFGNRAVILLGEADPIVLRAIKAEGSTVGQCGDEHDESYIEFVGARDRRTKRTITRLCHLAYGHTGMHSDGEATWTNGAGAQGVGTMQEALDGMRQVAAELAKATDVPPHYVTPLAPHPAQPLEEA